MKSRYCFRASLQTGFCVCPPSVANMVDSQSTASIARRFRSKFFSQEPSGIRHRRKNKIIMAKKLISKSLSPLSCLMRHYTKRYSVFSVLKKYATDIILNLRIWYYTFATQFSRDREGNTCRNALEERLLFSNGSGFWYRLRRCSVILAWIVLDFRKHTDGFFR